MCAGEAVQIVQVHTSVDKLSLYSGTVGKAVRVEEGGAPDSLVGPEHVHR